MSSMIERVARAITEENIRKANEFHRICGKDNRVKTDEQIMASVENIWRASMSEAAKAIEAMREPTVEMLKEGLKHSSHPGNTLKAMIDAALKEE